MPGLYRELIEVPERIYKGDFVLKLSEGVDQAQAEATVRNYVVTEQLATAFDKSLALIAQCAADGSNRAAYLHGSFGSGKSHFMAVLHLLLQGNPAARSIDELAPVLLRHQRALDGKRFLLVPYHLIGSDSMEAAVLGGYAAHVRKIHPEAPSPGVFRSEGLLDDARRLRGSMGDAAFFAKLNEGLGGAVGKWGALGGAWTAESFERAASAKEDDAAKAKLVGALVDRFFRSYKDSAGSAGGYLDLDAGLAVMAAHAKELGYHGVILFLDELVLWLASRVADFVWVTKEATKLPKLVEARETVRAVPIVSFIARQRDLKELAGAHLPGNQESAYADALKHWEGRFDVITLEDRNLHVIAEKRILRPRNDDARRELDRAFEPYKRLPPLVRSALLTDRGSLEGFRRTFPFAPVFVDVLVALSSALQRERTALKVMQQLLVDHRDTLRAGQLVPLGDVFDVLKDGDEPLTNELKTQFDAAKAIYQRQLQPRLESRFGVRHEDAAAGKADARKAAPYLAADRVVKTALLAALTPDVRGLANLTPQKLADLHHGWIPSGEIPGEEAAWVEKIFRDLAAQVGAVKIGDDPRNPSIHIVLSGIDLDAILERADAEDTHASRQQLIRDLVCEDVGAKSDGAFSLRTLRTVWRGTPRVCEVVFANVRDQQVFPAQNFKPEGTDWRLVVDLPFDPDENYGPRDDVRRAEKLRAELGGVRTICWIPDFFGRELMADLGRLVRAETVLKGDALETRYAVHLSAVERQSARSLLENVRSQLRQRLKHALAAAYGMPVGDAPGMEHRLEVNERLVSLDPAFTPKPPAGPKLRDAVLQVHAQALDSQFPRHPNFAAENGEYEIRTPALKLVLEVVERAAEQPTGRVVVDKDARPHVRRIAVPLGLGDMGEDAFLLAARLRQDFASAAEKTQGPVTVKAVREWIDRPDPRGLQREVQDLVVLAWAAMTQRTPFVAGIYLDDVGIGKLRDDVELRQQPLPDKATWKAAIEVANHAFGVHVADHITAANVARLSSDVQTGAKERRKSAHELLPALEAGLRAADVPLTCSRWATAKAAVALVESVVDAKDDAVVGKLAQFKPATSLAAVGASLSAAGVARAALQRDELSNVVSLKGHTGARPEEAASILARFREELAADESAFALERVLTEHARKANAFFRSLAAKPPAETLETLEKRGNERETRSLPPEPDAVVVGAENHSSTSVQDAKRALERLAALVAAHPDAKVTLSWTVVSKGKPR